MMDLTRTPNALAKCVIAAATMVVASGGSALAQDSWDGNIVFGNLLGEYKSEPAQDCDAVSFRDNGAPNLNDEVDPMLTDPFQVPPPSGAGMPPSFVPMPGSPAIGTVDDVSRIFVPADDFCNSGDCQEICDAGMTEVCWRGGMPPATHGPDWTLGWTYYNRDGAGRTDIDFDKPTKTIEGRVGVVDGLNDPGDTTLVWTADFNYLLRGRCYVGATEFTGECGVDGDELTIGPGTVILGENGTDGFLVIERGSDINAQGTATSPIIMTTDLPPGQMIRGGWGGLLINGCACANCADCRNGATCTSEGGNGGQFCANDDCDDSGTLRYVRVEYAGITVGENNELNAFTFNGVGCGTVAEYLQAHMGFDDNFEWFGGKMRARYLVATGGGDDHIDWQMGFRGNIQHVVSQHYDDDGDKGIEADNNEFGFDEPGRSAPTLANATFIGTEFQTDGINFRRGTDGNVFNTIIMGFGEYGLDIDDNATCGRGFWPRPGAFCGPAVAVEPTTSTPNVAFRAFPNPVVDRASFAFDVREAGDVDLSIFDINGRLVETVVDRELTAGTHSFDWQVPAGAPSSMYYYRFTAANGQEATGRFLRVR